MAELVLVGDVMLGRLVNEALSGTPPEWPWGDVLSLFQEADWRFCNLECVISDVVPPRLPDKAFHFRSEARNVAALRAAVDVVSCANNHSLDFGPEAMLDMLRLLDRARIGHAGAGADLEEAARPAISTARDGTRVAVIACTDNEPDWAATLRAPGLYYVPIDPRHPAARGLLDRVRRVRHLADLTVVSLHWGSNWGDEPEPGHRELAAELTEAGADLVVGHSSHVVRGIEVRAGKPVLYSAGDFIDDYAVDPVARNDRSVVFLVETGPGGPRRVRLRPSVIERCRARLARDDEADPILERMRRLCQRLGTHLEVREREGLIEIAPADHAAGASAP
ncbi:MAG TPA: CapA family protein [Candidatus Dormibacteraeota bacterium]|nr:CapA family protein [Candidatus Dormibacteraeota bacterium]